MGLNAAQLRIREYNLSQTEVGHPLKTLQGSVIKRSSYGVGKLIGGKLYLHVQYVPEVFDEGILDDIVYFAKGCPFDYNCIRYDIMSGEIGLVESPDFDAACEPVVGRMFIIAPDGSSKVTRFYNSIWHHKWLFVANDYTGFDVAESWEWSKEWLSVLTQSADGTSMTRWIRQLNLFGLD